MRYKNTGLLWVWERTFNLGQNKMRNESTPPPNSMMACATTKACLFSIIELGGGVVLIFHSIGVYIGNNEKRTTQFWPHFSKVVLGLITNHISSRKAQYNLPLQKRTAHEALSFNANSKDNFKFHNKRVLSTDQSIVFRRSGSIELSSLWIVVSLT